MPNKLLVLKSTFRKPTSSEIVATYVDSNENVIEVVYVGGIPITSIIVDSEDISDKMFFYKLDQTSIVKEGHSGLLLNSGLYSCRDILEVVTSIQIHMPTYFILPSIETKREREAFILNKLNQIPINNRVHDRCPICKSPIFTDRNNLKLNICVNIECMTENSQIDILNKFSHRVCLEPNDINRHSPLISNLNKLLVDYKQGTASDRVVEYVEELKNFRFSDIFEVASFYQYFSEDDKITLGVIFSDSIEKVIRLFTGPYEDLQRVFMDDSLLRRFHMFYSVNEDLLAVLNTYRVC